MLAASAQSQTTNLNPGTNGSITIPTEAPPPPPPVVQSQPSDQNSTTNGPVTIPPDASVQPQPAVQPPPPDAWDNFWKIEKVSSEDEWTRHFRIGAIVGLNIKADFNRKGPLPIPGNNAARGIFDDGYVIPNPLNTSGDNYTWDWSYDRASQLVGSTLTMHSTTSYTTSSSSEQSGVFPGFEMAYGGNLWAWKSARIGWEFGFGLLPISITDNISTNHPLSASISQTTYYFNTGGVDLTGILPGYQGGGDLSITNHYYSSSTTNLAGNVSGSQKLDVMLYTFRLGPTLYWDLNEDWGLTVGAGPALGLVSGSLRYDETITVNATGTSTRSRGRVDGTDLVYGGYVNAMLKYNLEKNGDIYVGAQYMPMGNARINGGGREARLNLNGQVYITAGVNWTF